LIYFKDSIIKNETDKNFAEENVIDPIEKEKQFQEQKQIQDKIFISHFIQDVDVKEDLLTKLHQREKIHKVIRINFYISQNMEI